MKYCKKIVIVIFVLCTCYIAIAQSDNRGMPPFKIRLTDGNGFTYKGLKKNVPTVLIYFSPTCEHCCDFAKELIKHETKLLHKQIVMICWEPLQDAKQFDIQYSLSVYPNIKIGSEGYSFIVQKYFNIQHYPFIACYNNNGKMLKILGGNDEKASGLVAKLIAIYK